MSGTEIGGAQKAYWNEEAGPKWVENQRGFDALLAPVLDRLLQHAAPATGASVIDIGCGAGTSSFALAEAVGAGGKVLGLDISEPLLALAESRREAATNPAFLLGDAQTHAFAPGAADLVTSRFGVMFFADPVAAFANIRTALRPGGRLVMACWAEIGANPWFSIPRDAAVARLGKPSPKDPRAPGPLAFAETDHALGILKAAGWTNARVSTDDLSLTPPGSLTDVSRFAVRLGPACRVMSEKNGTPEDEAAILDAVTRALTPYATEDGVRVPARIHFYMANA